MMFGLAAIVGPWIIALVPVVAGLFLLAPPIGIYKHDETPTRRTDVRLEAVAIDDESANTIRFQLLLTNAGNVPATAFRVRLLVPQKLVPTSASSRVLGPLSIGEHGRNWFVDATHDAITITFRTGVSDGICCPPGGRLEIATLNLPGQTKPLNAVLDYQVSGGSAAPNLGRLRLSSVHTP